jgi:hypothetical protein
MAALLQQIAQTQKNVAAVNKNYPPFSTFPFPRLLNGKNFI